MLCKYALVEELVSVVQASSKKTGVSNSSPRSSQWRALEGAPMAESASILRLLMLLQPDVGSVAIVIRAWLLHFILTKDRSEWLNRRVNPKATNCDSIKAETCIKKRNLQLHC